MTGPNVRLVLLCVSEPFADIATRLLALPTAANHEHFVIAEIQRFAAERRLPVHADRVGNIVLSSTGETDSGLCLTAHLDHPAMGFPVHESGRVLRFDKLGGVPVELAQGGRVLVFDVGGDPSEPAASGIVSEVLKDGAGSSDSGQPAFRVQLDAAAPDGQLFAVWDLPACRTVENRLEATACDDLAGVAVALTTLEQCQASAVGVSLLLTRAEETGFGGMLAAIQDSSVPEAQVYINIECSSCRAGAPLGEGPVLRVGDRRWIFDPGVTGALSEVARQLHETDDTYRIQRKLMDAGACEATPLARSGRATGAVALPLDNYHNDGIDRIRAEAIDLRDADRLICLLSRFAHYPGGVGAAVSAANADLDSQLSQRHEAQIDRLVQTQTTLPFDGAITT